MLREEFERRTGFFPPLSLYTVIHKYYTDFGGDKDDFCKVYRENVNGLAEKMQHEADMQEIKVQDMREMAKKQEKDYEARVAELKKLLECEQEWKAYEHPENVPQTDYERLAEGAETGKSSRYMTDQEAIEWICDEFDFNPDMITIIHEIDEYEVNRHGQLRRTGRKIDRRPIYCASDYHYIRFNTSHWYYEVWGGSLRPFWD